MKYKALLSLKSLIVLAFAAAAIPLFLGVTYAAFGLREAAELGKTINSQVFEQTKIIRLVLQQSSDIERKARLFVLLSDPSLRQPYERESYEAARVSFKQSLSDLLKLHVDNKIALLVNELSEKENLIYEQIISSESEDSFTLPIDEAFLGFRESSNTLSREFENHVEHTFNELGQLSESLEQGLLIKGAILLLFVCGIVLALLRVLSRSTQQLDNAIRRLGAGALLEPIVVNGPSDLHYLGERLDWLRTHLRTLESAKQQLMYNLAREIEQPLRAFRIAVGKLDNQDDIIVDQLTTNIEKLQTFSSQLREYSEYPKTSSPESWQTLDMQTLLENSLEGFKHLIQSKSIQIKKLTRPLKFEGIESHCKTIVDQLLDNAIQCSPANGEIRIFLRDNDDHLELEIEDDGPCIDPDFRACVFEPFFLGGSDESIRTANNQGLRLAIVKEYVSHHHGQIEFIDPRQDHSGARVRLLIPLDINA